MISEDRGKNLFNLIHLIQSAFCSNLFGRRGCARNEDGNSSLLLVTIILATLGAYFGFLTQRSQTAMSAEGRDSWMIDKLKVKVAIQSNPAKFKRG